MSKRKLSTDLLVNSNYMASSIPNKQIKLCEEYQYLLTGIDFDDFENDEASSEETVYTQSTKLSSDSNLTDVDELLHGIDFTDFNESALDANASKDNILDLTSWRRCVIETCERDAKTHDLIIRGREDITGIGGNQMGEERQMACRLQHNWSHSKINSGDIVSVIGIWDAKQHCYCVTSRDGFVVVRPDLLVSGTTVVGGLFCMRKAILSDRFKGIETGMKIMTIGSIVHELFQIVLRRKLTTRVEIEAASNQMLSEGGMAYTLYASQMDSAEARKEFNTFLDKIYDFVEQYIKVDSRKMSARKKTDDFVGKIDNIQDIEENIWVPRLGLKGKVDVSVNVRRRQNNGNSSNETNYIPLELKTGRASFSPEHTGQLIIYQMMMSEISQTNIDSGLLLYLREGVMREVKGSRNEKRDLIMLRNEISYYLAKQHESYANIGRRSKHDEAKTDSVDLLTALLQVAHIPELPPPINRGSVCATCPYNILCSVYLNQDINTMSSLDEKHPLREIAPLVTSHLTDAHINYFCHWVGLMALEDQESRKTNPMKTLWTESAEQRQLNGHAINNLKLNPNVVTISDDSYLHEFWANDDKELSVRGFGKGDYLIVSTNKRYAVAAGGVVFIDENAVKIVLERNLCDRYAADLFILDKYESQTSAIFNMANLGAILNDTEASERLRKIIVDKIPPTFNKTLPKIITTDGKPILVSLNDIQRSAVLKALTANEYLLLKGLPGTGKTQTVVAIIRLLVMMKKSVLITSHTHSAVDNVLLRLLKHDKNIKFLRLGSTSRIRSELAEHSEGFHTRDCKTPDELTAIYDQFNVFGVTCLGSGHPLLTQKLFDVCVVDESTQVFQSTVLRPLFSAKKFILVGDPDQLPPIVRSQMARNLGADESLFARLDSTEATVALTLQYRMNKTITKLANDLTYCGALKCGDAQIANATLKLKLTTKSKWLQKVLSPHIDQSVGFINTGNVYNINKSYIDREKEKDSVGDATQNSMDVDAGDLKSVDLRASSSQRIKLKNDRIYTNYCEAAIILTIVHELRASGIDGKMIGIIAPYALQVELMKKTIAKQFDDTIEVNTVDQYQGRDKEVIIYSCTRSQLLEMAANGCQSVKTTKNNEILDDRRRLTVAITRAKHKLILVGDMSSLEIYRPFKCLIDSMSGMNKMKLVDGLNGFKWQEVLSVIDRC